MKTKMLQSFRVLAAVLFIVHPVCLLHADPPAVTRAAALASSTFANVKDYGAVGDGTTDDTAAIQAAVTADLGGIYFPKGDYRVASSVTFSNPCIVAGAGREKTRIFVDATVDGFIFDSDFCSAHDLTIGGMNSGTMCGKAMKLGTSTHYFNNWFGQRINIQYAATGLDNTNGWDNSAFEEGQIASCTTGTIQCSTVGYFGFKDTSFSGNTVAAAGVGQMSCVRGIWGGNATSVKPTGDGMKFVADSIHFEAASSGTYLDGSAHSLAVSLVNCEFADGGETLVHAVVSLSSYFQSCSGGRPDGKLAVTQIGFQPIYSPDRCAHVTLNGIIQYVAGDFVVQSNNNALPVASANFLGMKYLQAAYTSSIPAYDEMFVCIKTGANAYGWQNLNLNAANITSDPGVSGTLWNNAGTAKFSP